VSDFEDDLQVLTREIIKRYGQDYEVISVTLAAARARIVAPEGSGAPVALIIASFRVDYQGIVEFLTSMRCNALATRTGRSRRHTSSGPSSPTRIPSSIPAPTRSPSPGGNRARRGHPRGKRWLGRGTGTRCGTLRYNRDRAQWQQSPLS
jgi:hypothetical protein